MKNTIEYIAYLLKRAKEEDLPKAIVFLGAGASASAGIPLASQIVNDIKNKCKSNPLVKELIKAGEDDYYKVMGALTADERRELFYNYITDPKVKINVTNIYLAQLLKENYIDFILTVNFDDLILRACGLFNFLPPVYDISNVNVPTTSNFREKSVLYLHGQHFGKWLLNKDEELEKVKNDISNIFNEIKNKRTWIIIGYSGQDEIFNQIANLGSFTSDLFWIGYKDDAPGENVMVNLLSKPNTNAHYVKGYDSDSFFLDLHSQLKLETPEVINKPFSFLKSIIEKVKDIDDYKPNKEFRDKYKSVKERMDISKEWIDRAIDGIESTDAVENFIQEIIEATVKENFAEKEAGFLARIASEKYESAKNELSNFFNNWGMKLSEAGEEESKEDVLWQSIEKYKYALEFNTDPDDVAGILNNQANSLHTIAKIRGSHQYFDESLALYERSINLDKESETTYSNYGNALSAYGKLKKDPGLYLKSFEAYKRSVKIMPNQSAFENWAAALINYSYILTGQEKEKVMLEAKKKATEVYKQYGASYNLACINALLGNKAMALSLLEESLSKKQIDIAHVIADADFDSLKEGEDFKALIAKY